MQFCIQKKLFFCLALTFAACAMENDLITQLKIEDKEEIPSYGELKQQIAELKNFDITTSKEKRDLSVEKMKDLLLKLPQHSTKETKVLHPIIKLTGHTSVVRKVAFSPNTETQQILASGGEFSDPTVRLWDVSKQSCIGILTGHTDRIAALAFCAQDSTRLASSSSDCTIKIWNIQNLENLRTIQQGAFDMVSIDFEKWIAAGYVEGTTTVLDIESGAKIYDLADPAISQPVLSVAYSPNGTVLAAGTRGAGVLLWDLKAQKKICVLPADDWVYSIAFNQDGSQLAFSCADESMELWEVRSRKKLYTFNNSSNPFISSVNCSPANKNVLAVTYSNNVDFYDLNTKSIVAVGQESNTTFPVTATFNKNGKLLAAGMWDYSIDIWNADGLSNNNTMCDII